MASNETEDRARLKFSRRRFMQKGLAAGAVAAGAVAAGIPALPVVMTGSREAPALPAVTGSKPAEDIRSSQSTVLKSVGGQIEKVRSGEKVFLDGDEVLGYLPREFMARRLIRARKSGGKVICLKAGYVYAVTLAGGQQAKELVKEGFRRLDFPEFRVFQNHPSIEAAAYQKHLAVGDILEIGKWALLIFGPEERGGVSYSKMRSLNPPAFLPDGSEFKTWELPLTFSRTYHVDQSHPQTSDSNPGTQEKPFKTINRAAQVLQPGERVVVGAGVYRECVRPARGGTDPEHMISYEAAPGARVVIKGSEILHAEWKRSLSWMPTDKKLWMINLPPEIFEGYNPFAISNYRQVNQMSYWHLPDVFSDPRSNLYFQVRGLLFQNGRRLGQVSKYEYLAANEGSFWVETSGLTIHIRPFGDIDPNQTEWEGTTREQIFAPEEYGLGFIRVKGFDMQNAGNSFPFPQRGAISAMIGHHWIIEDNTLQWVNGVGIDIGSQGGADPPRKSPGIVGHHIVRGNTLNDIGITGVTGPGPDNTLIEDNVFRRNAWHDCECLAECAAIKTHQNLNVLIRRNVVLDTPHGAGIYIDTSNSNSRICQNVVVGTGTNYPLVRGLGAIYVEAADAPNLVDHNFIWDSTYRNGIYSYTSTKLMIVQNLVGNCAGAGIMILDAPGRSAGNGGTIPSGNNRVFENILVKNGWNIEFFSSGNFSDFNLLGKAMQPDPFHFNVTVATPIKTLGKNEELELSDWRRKHGLDLHSSEVKITAQFNPNTLELIWAVRGDFTKGPPMEDVNRDFWGRTVAGKTVIPGPFGNLPKNATRIVVDPRPRRK